MIGERTQTVGAGMHTEREHLRTLANEGFDLAAVHFPHVNASGCIRVLTNFYSVPLPVGVEVQAKVYSTYVEIWHQGQCVARHERCFDRQQKVLDLEHYLEALTKKPGALAGSTPLEQWRAQGRWPVSFDRFWEMLKQRQGRQSGTRAMIDVLLLGRQYGFPSVRIAIDKAMELSYLEALLEAEVEERERNTVARRIREAHFPKVKTLEEFEFSHVPSIPATLVRHLAEGGYLSRSEPVILLGEAGTGKTHLAIGLGVAACRQRRRVRFTTAPQLVNELIEAKNNSAPNPVTHRCPRYHLIVIDEMAYVAMPEAAAEMMFQIIAGRAERAAGVVTTDLAVSEWATMFPNARLCKAMLDRFTRQGHIIET